MLCAILYSKWPAVALHTKQTPLTVPRESNTRKVKGVTAQNLLVLLGFFLSNVDDTGETYSTV